MESKHISLPVVAAMIAGLCGCDIADWGDSHRFTEDVHKTYALRSGGSLHLESYNGSVEIEGWDREEFDLSATKHASREDLLKQVQIEVTAATDSIRVRTIRPEGSSFRGSSGVRFRIRVPRKTKLDRVETSNGPVKVQLVDGEADIHTSNGPVTLDRLRGSAKVHTSNGPVTVSGIEGYFEAKTSNGPIKAELARLDEARGVRLTTSNGPVTLRLPEGVNAHIKANTSNGPLSCDLPFTSTMEKGKHRIEGTVGKGGPFVVVSTSNGPVRISQ